LGRGRERYKEEFDAFHVLTTIEPGDEGRESFFSVEREVQDSGTCFLRLRIEGFAEVLATIGESLLVDDEGLAFRANNEGYQLGPKNPGK
jgi:hypothetical protein